MRVLGVLSPITTNMVKGLGKFLKLCELLFPHCQMGIVNPTLKDYGKDEMESCVESAQPMA